MAYSKCLINSDSFAAVIHSSYHLSTVPPETITVFSCFSLCFPKKCRPSDTVGIMQWAPLTPEASSWEGHPVGIRAWVPESH